jgi:hypothetical protein
MPLDSTCQSDLGIRFSGIFSGPNFFAVNYTNPTIIAKKPTNILGQRTRLSDADAMKINKLYHCENYEGQAADLAPQSNAPAPAADQWSIL